MGEKESLENAHRRARAALAIMEEKAAGFGALNIPTHLAIEIEEKRQEIAVLEERLATLPNPTNSPSGNFKQPRRSSPRQLIIIGVAFVVILIPIFIVLVFGNVFAPVSTGTQLTAAGLTAQLTSVIVNKPTDLAQTPTLTITTPLPLLPYQVAWGLGQAPTQAQANTKILIPNLVLVNTGKESLLKSSFNEFLLGYHWFYLDGRPVEQAPQDLNPLDKDLLSGEILKLDNFLVTVPNKPYNELVLHIDLQQGGTWLQSKGVKDLELKLTITDKLVGGPNTSLSSIPYQATWGLGQAPTQAQAGNQFSIPNLVIVNVGTGKWVATGPDKYMVGYRWFYEDGREVLNAVAANSLFPLPNDINPGGRIDFPDNFKVTAPTLPGNNLVLHIDLIQYSGTGPGSWLQSKGVKDLELKIAITK